MSAHQTVVKRTWSIKYSQKLHDGSVRRSRSARMCSSYWSMHREYDASSRWRNLPSTTFHDSELRASMRSGSHSRTHLNIQHDTPDRQATACHTCTTYGTTYLTDQPQLDTPVQHTAWQWHTWQTSHSLTHLNIQHDTPDRQATACKTWQTSDSLTHLHNIQHDTPDRPATACHPWIYSTTHLTDQPELVTPVQHTAWHTWQTSQSSSHLNSIQHMTHLIRYNLTYMYNTRHSRDGNLTHVNNIWHDTPDHHLAHLTI